MHLRLRGIFLNARSRRRSLVQDSKDVVGHCPEHCRPEPHTAGAWRFRLKISVGRLAESGAQPQVVWGLGLRYQALTPSSVFKTTL